MDTEPKWTLNWSELKQYFNCPLPVEVPTFWLSSSNSKIHWNSSVHRFFVFLIASPFFDDPHLYPDFSQVDLQLIQSPATRATSRRTMSLGRGGLGRAEHDGFGAAGGLRLAAESRDHLYGGCHGHPLVEVRKTWGKQPFFGGNLRF